MSSKAAGLDPRMYSCISRLVSGVNIFRKGFSGNVWHVRGLNNRVGYPDGATYPIFLALFTSFAGNENHILDSPIETV